MYEGALLDRPGYSFIIGAELLLPDSDHLCPYGIVFAVTSLLK